MSHPLLFVILSALVLMYSTVGSAQQPTPTPTPQLSKEYIYLGGRLLATEEGTTGLGPQKLPAAPTITRLSRTPPAAGISNSAVPGESFTLTVTGTNLIAGSKVSFSPPGGIQVGTATPSPDSTQLTALVTVPFSAPQGSYFVSVINANGTASTPFIIGEPGPATISFDPASVISIPAGNNNPPALVIIDAVGTSFTSSSVVWINGGLYEPSPVVSGPSQLQFNIRPADTVSPGVLDITVRTPIPGGGAVVSNSLSFSVTASSGAPNPFPILDTSSLSPASITAGGGPFTLSIASQITFPLVGVNSSSFILVNGVARSTTFNPPRTLTTTINVTDIAHAGALRISIFNPAPGGGEALNTLSLPILPAAPPPPGPFSIALNGSSWVKVHPDRASSLNIIGPLTVEAWVNPTVNNVRQAIVEKYDATSGTNNGGYGLRLNSNGTVSFSTYQNSSNFDTITSQRVIGTNQWTHVAGVYDGSQFRIYIGGTQDLGASSSCGSSCRAPNSPSAAPLLIGASADRGPNGTDGFFVGNLDEIRVSASALYGTNFVPVNNLPSPSGAGLWKFDDQTLNDSSGNHNDGIGKGGSIQFSSSVPGFTGTVNLMGEAGGSNLATLDFMSKVQATQGDGSLQLTINGTHLNNSLVFSSPSAGNGITVSSVNGQGSQLAATVMVSASTAPGAYLVSVGNSDTLVFTVNGIQPNLAPSLAQGQVSPAVASVGSAPPQPFTVTGSNFVNGSIVRINGSDRVTHFQSTGMLTADLLSSDLEIKGQLAITVFNPPSAGGGGGTSGSSLTFAVTGPQDNPAPSLSQLCAGQPCSTAVQAGSASVLLRVLGSNFIQGPPASQIVFNNALRSDTSFISANELRVTLSSSDLVNATALPVSMNVAVTTPAPGGGTTAPLPLTVNPFYPIPTVTGLAANGAPPNVTAGGSGFTLQVMGIGFAGVLGQPPISIVNVNGAGRASSTTFKSSTELDVTITATDIQLPGQLEISVFTPAPGGGSSDPMLVTVNPATNPKPVLSSLSATQIQVDSTNVPPIVLTGTGFMSTSRVLVNGFPRATTFNPGDPTHLSAQLLDGDFAVLGQLQVRVSNPEPGGGTSNVLNLAAFAPAPALTSVAPTNVTAGSGALTITVTGSNFIDESSILVNGAPRPSAVVIGSNGTQLTGQLTAADVADGALLSITVSNPTNPPGGGTTGVVALTVSNPQPVLDATTPLTPTTVLAGGTGQTVTVLGTGFVPNSQVNIGNQNRATFIDPTHLSVALQAADIATGGTIAFAVVNPTPGGGSSATAILTVNNPVPTLDAVNPLTPLSVPVGSLTGNQTKSITILGTNFVPTSAVTIGTNRATFIDSSHLTLTLQAADIATAGTIPIVVNNPAPAGGSSGTANLLITNPAPSVTGLDQPTQTTNMSPLPQLAVLGSGFVTGATAQIKGASHAALSGSDSMHLVIQLIAADLSTAGVFAVTVTNPGPGGGVSATSSNLTVYDTPVITSLSPNNATVGQKSQPLITVNGSGFLPGSLVMFNGAAHTPTSPSTTTQLLIQLSLDDMNATAGVYPFTVVTPTPGGVSTPNANSNFTLNNAPPAGSSLSLPSVTTNVNPPPQLTIFGSGFVAGATPATSATVQIGGGAPHAPLAGSDSTHLIIQLSSADVGAAGSYAVTVTNPPPGGGISTVPTRFVVYDPPVVSGLSPNNATIGQKPPVVTVTGLNFIPGSVVMINGASHTPTTASTATQLVIQLLDDPDLSAAAGVYPVTVITPTSGGVSTPNANSNFTLNNPVPSMSTATPLTPASAMAGSGALSVTVQGSGFVPNSTVIIKGSNRATFVDSTHLQVSILASETAAAGAIPITVANSAPGGGSATAMFNVNNPNPMITSLSPNAVIAGSAPFTLTINGTGFVNTSQVQFNGLNRSASFVNANQLTVSIPASDVASVGTPSVTVTNPAPSGGSATATFNVNPASPDFTLGASPGSLSLVQTTNGSTILTVGSVGGFTNTTTLSVAGLPSGVTATFSSINVTPPSGGSATSKLTLSTSSAATTGTFTLTVTGTSGKTSHTASLTLTVTPANPVPSISGISPANVFSGGSDFTLTISGSGFMSSSTIFVGAGNNFGPRATTFVSPSQLTVQITSSDIATSGTQISVSASNPAPGGGMSNQATLNVQ